MKLAFALSFVFCLTLGALAQEAVPVYPTPESPSFDITTGERIPDPPAPMSEMGEVFRGSNIHAPDVELYSYDGLGSPAPAPRKPFTRSVSYPRGFTPILVPDRLVPGLKRYFGNQILILSPSIEVN